MLAGYGLQISLRRLKKLIIDTPDYVQTRQFRRVQRLVVDSAISVNYKSEIIKNYIQNGSSWDLDVDYIEEKKPSYLVKNNNDSLFILDDLGMILDIDFLSQSIPEVELVFDDFHVYNTFNNEINLNKIFENINKIKSNNQNLLDVFTILNSFDKLNFSNELHSVSIDSSYIKIKLFSTDIFFNKNKNIKKQIEKFSKMVNNLDKNKEQISFNNISDLSQIRLGADKQIIYKEK